MKTPILFLVSLLAMMAGAESPLPGPDGWITLFDGKDLSAFTDAGGGTNQMDRRSGSPVWR